MNKAPSRRQIHTAEGQRPDSFGIVGKGFDDKQKKPKDPIDPRKEGLKKKQERKPQLKERELDSNVMITGNQLRPEEIVANEKPKNVNQKSIIGWFYKHKK